MQETKNVTASGGGAGLKSHLECAEQFSELRGMALRGHCSLMSLHLSRRPGQGR